MMILKILNLKNIFLPKGLVPLEDLFDSNDVARKPKMEPLRADIEEVNIGTTANPKLVKLSKALPPKIKDKYISLMASFADVFSWDYSYLKIYDTNIIQHTIPIKPNQKPFRQKLRRINPSCCLSPQLTLHSDATVQSEACHRNDTKLLIKSNSSTVLYAHRRHRVSDQCKHHKISMWAFQHSIRSNGASRALHIPHWSPKH